MHQLAQTVRQNLPISAALKPALVQESLVIAEVLPQQEPTSLHDKYYGSPSEFIASLAQWELHISLRSNDFLNNQNHVGFLISLVTEEALF